MSSIMSKQLTDFLQEKQEPFVLEVYLLERGYSSSNVATCLRRSVSSGLKSNRKTIPNCSKIVRALFTRLVSVTGSQRISNSRIIDKNIGVSEIDSSRQEIPDDDEFSTASSATVFNSCSESDGEEAHYSSRKDDKLAHYSSRKDDKLETADYYLAAAAKDKHVVAESKVGADQRFIRESAKESKHLGPVSVLEGTESEDRSQFCRKRDYGRRTQRHFSTSVANKSEKQFSSSFGEIGKPDASSQYAKNKKAVEQTRQLLFDCVREVVEKHKNDSPGRQQIPRIMGPEKLWELVCQNIWLWSKESINETNTNNLLHMLASAQEWSSFEQQMHEIGEQIADAILEDISNEII